MLAAEQGDGGEVGSEWLGLASGSTPSTLCLSFRILGKTRMSRRFPRFKIQSNKYRKNIYSGPEQNWNTPKNRRLFQFCSAPALFWGGYPCLVKKNEECDEFFLPKDALCTWVGWEWG